MKGIALLGRFLLEVAAIAALVYAGVGLVDGVGGWLIGLATAAVVGVVWGLFIAPRARIALPTPTRLVIEVAVFVLAGAMLLAAGHPLFAGLLVGLYVLDRLALLAAGAPAYESDPRSA